jgi:F0F1-type ATP synthase delta subunit
MVRLAAKRYAKALFELYLENDEIAERLLNEVAVMSDILANEPEYMRFLCSPMFTPDEKNQRV